MKKNNFVENEDEKREDSQNEKIFDQEIETTECIDEDENQQEDEIEQLKQKYVELNDKNLRLMAEFDNYRKRTLKERTDLIKTAGESIFVNILPLIDDFERALKAMESATDVESVKEGVELIYNKFTSFLNQNGVKEIPTENELFDTDVHEAVTTFPAPNEDMRGKVMECLTKGYTLNDKVIRFPKVVVCE